ncbi:predicted protein [Histoplasma mississippiense (nom. inval.)]|uniref:predicted protein n=1 Tax=Ajellomyces capsulatus (strain NAm1 / WU24) TaxID=2059318 RepID=UPI000157C246|nr:predicted protein [Histoplasma mississippiense (nom. inval.)]EDN07616.1 predicted protein [Histoplasma mississippiense (nom. inval.)]
MQHRARVPPDHTVGSGRSYGPWKGHHQAHTRKRARACVTYEDEQKLVMGARPRLIVTRSLRPPIFPRLFSCKRLSVRFADIPRQSTESWAWAWQATRRRDTALGYKDPRPTFQEEPMQVSIPAGGSAKAPFCVDTPPQSARSGSVAFLGERRALTGSLEGISFEGREWGEGGEGARGRNGSGRKLGSRLWEGERGEAARAKGKGEGEERGEGGKILRRWKIDDVTQSGELERRQTRTGDGRFEAANGRGRRRHARPVRKFMNKQKLS